MTITPSKIMKETWAVWPDVPQRLRSIRRTGKWTGRRYRRSQARELTGQHSHEIGGQDLLHKKILNLLLLHKSACFGFRSFLFFHTLMKNSKTTDTESKETRNL